MILTHDVIELILVFRVENLLKLSCLNSLDLADGDVIVVIEKVFKSGADGVHQLIGELRWKDKNLVIDSEMFGKEQTRGEKGLLVFFWCPQKQGR